MEKKVAQHILNGFDEYFATFLEMTRKAKGRFEAADWQGAQRALEKRLLMRKKIVKRVKREIVEQVGEQVRQVSFWQQVKVFYTIMISDYCNNDIAETFFNSVFCKIFHHTQINNDLIFVSPAQQYNYVQIHEPIHNTFYLSESPEKLAKEILLSYDFSIPYENLDLDVHLIGNAMRRHLLPRMEGGQLSIEMLKSVFYRNKGAYLVGRAVCGNKTLPFLLPVLNNEHHALYVDTLIIEPNEVSVIFSFTRSYFMVDTPVPSLVVQFLKTIIKEKSISEIYNSIGFNKHGKTEFYRDFLAHLDNSVDKFVIALVSREW
ncbi:isocitrate dehydrogenase kinase/phosphatase AceK regulatory subunit [Limibacter armeniacum]|uniref:isocitrate dehydrogenase kinase/phosphatase AceK regulatory subunit n=1 Tax=Limibacter armeniacum TaxID=466084 RepID=UPI002FE60108